MSFFGNLFRGVASVFTNGLSNSAYAEHDARLQSKLQYSQWAQQQSNAHQLEVQDLKAAGLNPILSASGGQVVSQPSINVDHGSSGDFLPSLINAFSAAANAETQKTNAETERIKADTDIKRQNVEEKKAAADIAVSQHQIELIKQQTYSEKMRTGMIVEQIQNLIQERENGVQLTNAQVKQLGAVAYNMVAMVDIQKKLADAEEKYKASQTDYNKKLIDSLSKEADVIKDKYKAELLKTPYGEFCYKFGEMLRLENPFDGGRVGPLGTRGNGGT